MIKAIVFDCYNVLARDGWLPFKDRYFAADPAKLQEALDLNKQFDGGYIAIQDYVAAIAELAGVTPAEAQQQLEQTPSNDELWDCIAAELKPHYKIGLLSNAGANWLPELFTPEQLALLDATLISYEIGVVKPDPRMYEGIAERLGVLPEECVFIDDQERYCIGARDVGMQAIHFIDNVQLQSDLARLL